jgi:hypothetical protein
MSDGVKRESRPSSSSPSSSPSTSINSLFHRHHDISGKVPESKAGRGLEGDLPFSRNPGEGPIHIDHDISGKVPESGVGYKKPGAWKRSRPEDLEALYLKRRRSTLLPSEPEGSGPNITSKSSPDIINIPQNTDTPMSPHERRERERLRARGFAIAVAGALVSSGCASIADRCAGLAGTDGYDWCIQTRTQEAAGPPGLIPLAAMPPDVQQKAWACVSQAQTAGASVSNPSIVWQMAMRNQTEINVYTSCMLGQGINPFQTDNDQTK